MNQNAAQPNAHEGVSVRESTYFVRLPANKYHCQNCNRLLLTGRVVYVEIKCTRCGDMNIFTN